MNVPKVIDQVLNNDLCIGCGICESRCPNDALSIRKSKKGFLEVSQKGNCDDKGECIKVCPFDLYPNKNVSNENKLGDIFLNTKYKDHQIGKFEKIYVGYSKEYRLSSSSGGIATYILTQLLEKKIVDYVISVKEDKQENQYYNYGISTTKDELLNSSKTRYTPVSLSNIFSNIKSLNGTVAVVGVACFIKAIRLTQYYDPEINQKIKFTVGIICGGVKSDYFTEYLADKISISSDNIISPEYRIKNIRSDAGDYSFGCNDKQNNNHRSIRMREVGDMWGTGLFKANACDFCDDVTTELADISVGDAWMNPYVSDGRGTNVIITRSLLAQDIIETGRKNNSLEVNEITKEKFIESQKGSFNHRHTGLPYRVNMAKKKGKAIPSKRITVDESTFFFKLVQYLRLITREKSLELWEKNKSAVIFDRRIHKYIYLLRMVTKMNHRINSVKNRFKKIYS